MMIGKVQRSRRVDRPADRSTMEMPVVHHYLTLLSYLSPANQRYAAITVGPGGACMRSSLAGAAAGRKGQEVFGKRI